MQNANFINVSLSIKNLTWRGATRRHRPVAIALILAFTPLSYASTPDTPRPPKYPFPQTVQRAILSVCSGAVSDEFRASCSSHRGYEAVHLRLSSGGCMEMCCTGHPSTGYTCVSDPNAIVDRRSTPLNNPLQEPLKR